MGMTPLQLLEEIQKGGETDTNNNNNNNDDDDDVWNMIQCLSNLSRSIHCVNHDKKLQLFHWMTKFMNLQSSSSFNDDDDEKEWMKEWKMGLEWIQYHPDIDAHILVRYVLEMMTISFTIDDDDDNNNHSSKDVSIYLGMILLCFAIQKQQQKLHGETNVLLSWKRYIHMIMETIATFQKYYLVVDNNSSNLLLQQMSFALLDHILQQVISTSMIMIVPDELHIKYKWIKEGWIATSTQMIPFIYHDNYINHYPQHYHASSCWWLISFPSIIHDLLFYHPIRNFVYTHQNRSNKDNDNNCPDDDDDECRIKFHAKELMYCTIHPLTSCDQFPEKSLDDFQDSYLMGMNPKLDRLGIALLAHYYLSSSQTTLDYMPRVYSPNHLYLLFFPHAITLLTAAGQQESPQKHSSYHQYGIDILTFILDHTPYLHPESFLPNNASHSKFFILRETRKKVQDDDNDNNKNSVDPLPWSPLTLIQCIFQESLYIQLQQPNTSLSSKDHQRIQKLWNVLRNILNVYNVTLQVEYLLHLWRHYYRKPSSSSTILLEDNNPEQMMLPPKILDLMRSPIRMILVLQNEKRADLNPNIASKDMDKLANLDRDSQNSRIEPLMKNTITCVLRPVFVDLLEKCFEKNTTKDESLASKLLPRMELYVSILALLQLALHTTKQKAFYEDDSIFPLSLLLEHHKEPRNIDNFIVTLTEMHDKVHHYFHTTQHKSYDTSDIKDSGNDSHNEDFRLMLLLHSLEQTIDAASSLK